MTTTTTATILNLPRNKTGLFAGDTLQDVRGIARAPIAFPPPTLPRQSRNSASIKILLPLPDYNAPQPQYRLAKYDAQMSSRTNRNSDMRTEASNDSYLTTTTMRTSFRPSPIRRQKLHVSTSLTSREVKEPIISKPQFVPSHTSTKLKSEIDQINSKIKSHGSVAKLLRLPANRDSIGTPRSTISHATSCRLSSASTHILADRAHQRFPSAMTNITVPTLPSTPGPTESSNKPMITLTMPPTLIQDEENSRLSLAHHVITHAYQIPQQANVGCDSILPTNPPPSPSSFKTHSAKHDAQSHRRKSASYPFYVMYFSNLTMQQNQNNRAATVNYNQSDSHENDKASIVLSAGSARKKTATTRVSTSYSRSQSTRRRPQSPTSMNTHSTLDDDESMVNSTSYYNSKRFSAKIAAFERENTDLLKDVLRTTSWNHVQV